MFRKITNIIDSYIWKFFVDISGFIATIVYLITFLKWLFSLQISLPFQLTILILPILSIIVLIISNIRKFFSNIKDFHFSEEKKKLTKESSKISGLKDITETIPKDRYVEDSFKHLKDEARKWSEDVILTSFSLYIDRKDNKIKYTVQSSFYSPNKDLSYTFYLPSYSIDGDYEEGSRYKEVENKAFFELNPNWRLPLAKILKKLEERVSTNFSIHMISHHDESVYAHITFKQGRIRNERSFLIQGGNFSEIEKS